MRTFRQGQSCWVSFLRYFFLWFVSWPLIQRLHYIELGVFRIGWRDTFPLSQRGCRYLLTTPCNTCLWANTTICAPMETCGILCTASSCTGDPTQSFLTRPKAMRLRTPAFYVVSQSCGKKHSARTKPTRRLGMQGPYASTLMSYDLVMSWPSALKSIHSL